MNAMSQLPEVPFTWPDTFGWLVLSGSPDALSEIRAQALSRYNAAGAIAYISLAGDLGDALMDDMAELGAPAGYLIDLDELDNNEIHQRLSSAGMIVIEAPSHAGGLACLLTQTVKSALKSALDDGALILLEGAAASLAGEHRLTESGVIAPGLQFLHNALIAPGAGGLAGNEWIQTVQRELPTLSIIALARGSALALGPAQQIETWGDGEVTINLGDLSARQNASP
ncbi:MAG: hypothetical protein OXI34_16435 [Chloroflexota bacterium]|nr:hypothetical protein [Chloroflexota bacterium]MDE2946979.1 hypothetical protein [Chloroflexota bacterium]